MSRISGFTLVELTMVIGIVMVLMGLSSSFYARFLVQNSVDNTVNQIVEDLRKAQVYSMSGKLGTDWGVRYSDNTVTLYAKGINGQDERSVVNPSISVSGLTDVMFYRMTGTPSSFQVITVTGNNSSKTIDINSLGSVSRQ
jgi:Tfp pilus assembly major pilin PilA